MAESPPDLHNSPADDISGASPALEDPTPDHNQPAVESVSFIIDALPPKPVSTVQQPFCPKHKGEIKLPKTLNLNVKQMEVLTEANTGIKQYEAALESEIQFSSTVLQESESSIHALYAFTKKLHAGSRKSAKSLAKEKNSHAVTKAELKLANKSITTAQKKCKDLEKEISKLKAKVNDAKSQPPAAKARREDVESKPAKSPSTLFREKSQIWREEYAAKEKVDADLKREKEERDE
jgi:hypothetical protein